MIEPVPDWFRQAVCRPDPSWNQERLIAHVNQFFDRNGVPEAKRQYCAHCPVTDQCTMYGITESYGVWGNRNQTELSSLRRQMNIRRKKYDPDS